MVNNHIRIKKFVAKKVPKMLNSAKHDERVVNDRKKLSEIELNLNLKTCYHECPWVAQLKAKTA